MFCCWSRIIFIVPKMQMPRNLHETVPSHCRGSIEVPCSLSGLQYTANTWFYIWQIKVQRLLNWLSSVMEVSCHFRFLDDIPMSCMWCLSVPHQNSNSSYSCQDCDATCHESVQSYSYMNCFITCILFYVVCIFRIRFWIHDTVLTAVLVTVLINSYIFCSR